MGYTHLGSLRLICRRVRGWLATTQQQHRRAATLFGLAEQLSRQIRYALVEPVRVRINAALATIQGELGAEIFAEAFAIGDQLSLNEAFTTILVPGHLKNIRPP